MSWVEATTWSGDLRLRHDTQWRSEIKAGSTDERSYSRNRERFRLRFGFKTKITDRTTVGARLASGSGFQNTTNQSFDDHARGKRIFIDRAYATWKPVKQFNQQAGSGGRLLQVLRQDTALERF